MKKINFNKNELKIQLNSLGIKFVGNYVRKADLEKVLAETVGTKQKVQEHMENFLMELDKKMDGGDEAFHSIISIRKDPPYSLKLSCDLSKKFRIYMHFESNKIILENEYKTKIDSSYSNLFPTIKKLIYDTNELAINRGEVKKSPYILPDSRPKPPKEMDMPIWDEKTKKWYDAER